MKLSLDLAANDYRNGQPSGKTDRIEIEDFLQMEGPSVSCTIDRNKLEIDGLHFNLKGYRTWVGNWCWDSVLLESAHVAKIINHLLNKSWSVFEAEANLFDWIEAGLQVFPNQLEALKRIEMLVPKRESKLE